MAAPPPVDFLGHRHGDAVAVAVHDVEPGPARVGFLDGAADEEVLVTTPVPLGHKVALADLEPGQDVVEYGVRTALASAAVRRGEHVHIHNVRSARWHTSVA
ncbi:UxaA family hydrolase [Vallicoccus soli]|uniref:SAF domain-containing protein n=1 Tax=Vallicoccus soli TaxID=2339232 RepID=A0A3A3ZLY3_9ACTN|nr:UxaA family hydrolase [Vallicoccus soli]RJK97565.1 hypothetical protein D5H78_00555 [Vallicoccus soli]